MAKTKQGTSSVARQRKNHGPKRKMFHCWSSTMRLAIAKAGLLTKYRNKDSFILACQARGLKHGTADEWDSRFELFTRLKTKEEQNNWLTNCKNYIDPSKENKKKASHK